jgi:hypothetical protein
LVGPATSIHFIQNGCQTNVGGYMKRENLRLLAKSQRRSIRPSFPRTAAADPLTLGVTALDRLGVAFLVLAFDKSAALARWVGPPGPLRLGPFCQMPSHPPAMLSVNLRLWPARWPLF